MQAIKTPTPPTGEAAARIPQLRELIGAAAVVGVSGDSLAGASLLASAPMWFSVIGGLLPEAALTITRAGARERLVLRSPSSVAAPRLPGRVEAIVIAPEAEAPMVRVDSAVARAERGLEGDRYFEKRGTFSNVHGRGYDLTLIEAEVLDTLELPMGQLAPEEARGTCSPAGSTSPRSSASRSPSATSSALGSGCASHARTSND